MRPLDRRTFLKDAAVVSAAAAASATFPGVASSAAAPEHQAGLIWKKAPCRFCGVGCGLLVGIESGRAVAVKGDPDSPVSRGTACAKGYYSVQALYGRDRITRAMVRRDGALVEVPLTEALDLVARKLQETVRQHGKDSVALYGSAQWTILDAYVASKLFKGGLGTNNLETSTRLYGASAMAGLQSSFGLDGAIGCYEDIDHADVFVLWDVNLAETDPVLFSRMLERRRKDPAVRIIHLSTRTTRTSYAADQCVLHAPHGGLVIANAICREIIDRKLVHREFVDQYVAFKRGATDIGDGLAHEIPLDGRGHRRHLGRLRVVPQTVYGAAGAGAVRRTGGEHSLARLALWGPVPPRDVGLGHRGESGRSRHLDEQSAPQHPLARRERSRRRATAPSAPRDSPAAGAPCMTPAA